MRTALGVGRIESFGPDKDVPFKPSLPTGMPQPTGFQLSAGQRPCRRRACARIAAARARSATRCS
jgi:hypothetical protein